MSFGFLVLEFGFWISDFGFLILGSGLGGAGRHGPKSNAQNQKFTHNGPLIPPSFRTRQKWMASSSDAAKGMAMQCST
jgi:hypothetical protein